MILPPFHNRIGLRQERAQVCRSFLPGVRPAVNRAGESEPDANLVSRWEERRLMIGHWEGLELLGKGRCWSIEERVGGLP